MAGGSDSEEGKLAEIRKYMSAQAQSLNIAAPTLANEYLSKEEMTFKKKKVGQHGSGDLLASAPDADADELKSDLGNQKDRGKANCGRLGAGRGVGVVEEDMYVNPAEVAGGWSTIECPEVDLSKDVAPNFEDNQKSFKCTMNKAKTLKISAAASSSSPSSIKAKEAEKVCVLEKLKEAAERKKHGDGGSAAESEVMRQRGEVMFNATSEFFHVLGELPTHGQSGNQDSNEEDQLDFKQKPEAEEEIEDGIVTRVTTGKLWSSLYHLLLPLLLLFILLLLLIFFFFLLFLISTLFLLLALFFSL